VHEVGKGTREGGLARNPENARVFFSDRRERAASTSTAAPTVTSSARRRFIADSQAKRSGSTRCGLTFAIAKFADWCRMNWRPACQLRPDLCTGYLSPVGAIAHHAARGELRKHICVEFHGNEPNQQSRQF
jgi:hypothetical protein